MNTGVVCLFQLCTAVDQKIPVPETVQIGEKGELWVALTYVLGVAYGSLSW